MTLPVRFAHRFAHLLAIALAMSVAVGHPSAQAQAAGQTARNYIDPARFDTTRFMSPPPRGLEEQEDMRVVERWQQLRTQAMADKALADSTQEVFVFAEVVGPAFRAESFPVASRFFQSVYKTESDLNKQGKERWARTRPHGVNPNLKPVGKFGSEGSYPSGHATFGWLAGIVLSDMIPEKRSEIMMRAREYGLNRIIGGVHYPSDIEAGRILASIIALEMQRNEDYLRDFEEARNEVRKGLSLPR